MCPPPRICTLVNVATFAAKLVVTEKAGHVTTISINRPEVRNCVNVETAEQLYDAFQEFEKDDDAYVAVFYGKGEKTSLSPMVKVRTCHCCLW